MKYTLSLKENRQFRRLYAKGQKAVSPYLALYCRRSTPGENRLGITVSGKLGIAVRRNLIRRRLKEAYRVNEEKFLPGHLIVVVARTRAMDAPYAVLERHFLKLAGELKLLKPERRDGP